MKLEDQVCSLELAKKLKELGMKQESYTYWYTNHAGTRLRLDREKLGADWADNQITSAFTVAELEEMLPFVTIEKYLCQERPRFNTHEEKTMEMHSWHDENEADARAKMLIYLIEKKLVKI